MRLCDLDNLKRRVKKSTVSALLKAGMQVFIETEEVIDPKTIPIVQELREQLAKLTAEHDALLKELAGECGVCAHYEKCRNNPCYFINGNMWEWRG